MLIEITARTVIEIRAYHYRTITATNKDTPVEYTLEKKYENELEK